jgi:MarR family transcriptional regulator, multiple antibiotic resistance protein MarR
MRYPRTCAACGADNRPIAKICDQCGASLGTSVEAQPAPADWQADLNRPRVMAARLLNHAYSVTYRLSEHRLRPFGISPVQWRAVSLTRLLPPPVTPSILALHLALDSRTVSDLVSRLEQCGWVRRVRDLPDRRAVRLELTDEGEAALAAAWGPTIDASNEVWSVVEPDELRVVLRVLRRVRDASLEKLGYRPDEIFALAMPEIE